MNNDADLARRLSFIQMDEKSRAALRAVSSVVNESAPDALKAFYEQIRTFPETRRFFGDDAHMARASKAQGAHWANITKGDFGKDYVQSARTIGAVHARIGLEPRWYIGGYAIVIEKIVQAMVEHAWPSRLGDRLRSSNGKREFADGMSAFMKAVMLDMDIVISMYFELAEEQRRKAEQAAIKSEQEQVSKTFGEALAALSKGDLTVRISGEMAPAYEGLKADFNTAMQTLEETMRSVIAGGQQIGQAVSELTEVADSQARRTEQQAASLEETAAALNQITASVQQGAARSAETRALVTSARRDAEAGGEVVSQGVEAMERIETSSSRIGDIVNVIDEIAFQTNLLALNAGVEAARAGESGKGFAVVASEVRALAQRSAAAAKEIKTLIASARSEVEDGVALVSRSGESFTRIIDNMTRIDSAVAEVAVGTQEQAVGLGEVNSAMSQMDQLTQQNAAMAEEATAACHSAAGEADNLAKLMSGFHVDADMKALRMVGQRMKRAS